MNKELKPCPHCGSKGKLLKFDLNLFGDTRIIYRVECENKKCSGMSYSDNQKAIAAWNKRVTEEKK